MAVPKFRYFSNVLDRISRVIAIIALFVGLAFLFIHPLFTYAQVSVEPRSLAINSTMITKAVTSTNQFVASPKSNILSFELMPPNISRVPSYSNSSAVLPSIQIPSFTVTNASLAISYDTLNGLSMSNIIEQPVTKISKGILSASEGRLNISNKIPQK